MSKTGSETQSCYDCSARISNGHGNGSGRIRNQSNLKNQYAILQHVAHVALMACHGQASTAVNFGPGSGTEAPGLPGAMQCRAWLSMATAVYPHVSSDMTVRGYCNVITMSQYVTKCHCHLSITMSLYVMALDSTIPSKLHGKFKPYDTVLCIWVGLPPALVLQLRHAQKNYPHHFARFPSTFKDSFCQ